MTAVFAVDRRDFLRLTSAVTAGLVLGCRYEESGARRAAAVADRSHRAGEPHQINAFLEIDTNGNVKIWAAKSEMGQGVRTALPMIVAEELDAEWSRVSVVQADLDSRYGGQGTGGSSSVRTTWMPLRRAGAAARAMLVAAAAREWGVDPGDCMTANGEVRHQASGRSVPYGDLAERAAGMPVPDAPALKDPTQFRIIGRGTSRVDNVDIASGRATFGIDVRVPGMLYAAIARPPAFGATVTSFDDAGARALPGVKDVFTIEPAPPPNHVWGGVCVVADSTWNALRAREALTIDWNMGPHARENESTLRAKLESLIARKGKVVRQEGDVDAALSSATRRVEAVYDLPFLAHAPMEPMNATVSVRGGTCEIWAPTQFMNWASGAVAAALSLEEENITVHCTMLGGGFGRRAFPDFVLEAAYASRTVGAPVKVQWTREDDTRWIRSSGVPGLRSGSCVCIEKGRRSREGAVDARGRHPVGLLPSGQHASDDCGNRCRRTSDRLEASHCVDVNRWLVW